MSTTYFNTREVELAVQDEATYGTKPGTVAAGDFFKATSRLVVTPVISRYFRDQDGSVGQGSILGVQQGRTHSEVKIDVDAIPSGSGTTPPDIDLLLVNAFGKKHTGTADTTTGSGSTGTTLELTTGGGSSSGIAIGDLIGIDVDATYGIEVRRVVNISTDTVTLDRALSADPASGRAVHVGTTYSPSFSAVGSLYLWQFITTVKHAVPGLIVPDHTINVDYSGDTPNVKESFSGMGMMEVTHTDTRPTPTTTGDPLIPDKGRAWIGDTKFCLVNASLHTNNGRGLRMNESCSLDPTGVKFTGNNGYFLTEAAVSMLLATGDIDTSAIYNSAKDTVANPFDLLVQNGATAGKIVAWSVPRFIVTPGRVELDGEMGVSLAGGRGIGTTGDDDVFLAFL